jgi:hypothetical protein
MRSELEIFAKHTIESGGEWRIIDKSGNVGLYESKNKYMLEHSYCYDTPVFQVFNHGKRIFSSTNYYYALKEYKRTIKEERITDE